MTSLRHYIDLVESAGQAVPAWFAQGRPVTHDDLDRMDAAEFIEGDEWDHEWRLCDVPLDLLPGFSASHDFDTPDEVERFDDIRQWFAGSGIETALTERPLVLLYTSAGTIKMLDGFHRAHIAREYGATTVKAVVGLGDSADV